MNFGECDGIQCFNCHASIPVPSLLQKPSSTCDQCLQHNSRQVTTIQSRNQISSLQLKAHQTNFQSQLAHFRTCHSPYNIQQDPKQQLAALEQEWLELKKQDARMEGRLTGLQSQLEQTLTTLDNQSMLLRDLESQANQLRTENDAAQWELRELNDRKTHLERLSALGQLYCIHFEDKTAYLNQQPVDHRSCLLLLQILCHLASIYNYKGLQVNFGEGIMRTDKEVPLATDCPESTLPWLTCMVQQTALLWDHMRLQGPVSTRSLQKEYRLPFGISLEGEIAMQGVILRADGGYLQFLKCLAHNLKFMVGVELSTGLGNTAEAVI